MNLLVTGSIPWTEENLDRLRQLNHCIIFMQYETDELPCEPSWVEGIIGNGIFLSHDISKFVNLKLIQLTSAGFDRVPLDYINEHGIRINNARGVYSIPMAEFAICGVLELYKRSVFFFENKKEHRWEKSRELLELFGKTVCILGCGSVGTECAKRFKAFGCHVIGVDIATYSSVDYDEMLSLDTLPNALQRADVVVLTLPLTESTHHLIDKNSFAAMKSGAVLVNIARGGVVDTEALLDALQGKLMGAVLDVFEEEPISQESPLWDIENVILTPHNSFIGDGNGQRLTNMIFKTIKGI